VFDHPAAAAGLSTNIFNSSSCCGAFGSYPMRFFFFRFFLGSISIYGTGVGATLHCTGRHGGWRDCATRVMRRLDFGTLIGLGP